MDLQATRSWIDGAPAAISYAEIDAWSRLTKTRPTPREVRVIKLLDSEYRRTAAKGRKRVR